LAEYQAALDEFKDDLTPTEMSAVLRHLQTDEMTPEERELKRFTCRNLKKLSNWKQWDEAFDDQLNKHLESGAFEMPVPRPKPVDGHPANVLRIQWSNLVKTDGTRKCCACIDGSK
jgi:hypothetical protein